MKLKRQEDRFRLCGLCCSLVTETDFPGKEWICADCLKSGRKCIIPLIKVGDVYRRYDTRKVFEGWRVFKVVVGDTREQYETEVRSPKGEFYAAGGDCIAFCTKTARTATMLLTKFPTLRVFVAGDDGRTVLMMPSDLFPKVALAVKAYRGRKSETPRTDRQKAAIEKARAARKAAAMQPTLL